MQCLGDWEKFLHDENLPPLVHAALAHAQFEAIHPFLDGNGRVGRLLITLLLVDGDVIPAPLLYLSAYFERPREEYYSRLQAITERGEWEEWLAYFLKGVAAQAGDVLFRIQRIDDLVSPWRRELSRGRSPLPGRALDLFIENPYWSVGGLSERLEVAFSTAQRAIDRIESLGAISLVGDMRRNRIYCAWDILEVLEEGRLPSEG